jgi:hypothetical protein
MSVLNNMLAVPTQLHNGFGFVKLQERSKRPIETNWTNRPLSLADIQPWIAKGGNYGVLGGHGGLIIIDCDVDELATWVRMKFPATFSGKTGSGKFHFYYLCPEIRKKIVLKKNGQHCGEIISSGSQVVGPSSIHPNGGKYVIDNDAPIAKISSSDLYDCLSEYIPDTNIVQSNSFKVPDKIVDGTRDETLYKLSCSLRSKGLSDEAILAAVREENTQKCDPPLPESIVKQKVKSAMKYPPGVSKTVKRAYERYEVKSNDDQLTIVREDIPKKKQIGIRPFPINLIPKGLIKDYLETVRPTTEAPDQYHVAAFMVLIAWLVGRKAYLNFGVQHIYPNLYTNIIGESGITRKSTALRPILNWAYEFNSTGIMSEATSNEAFIHSFRENPNILMICDEYKSLIETCNKPYGRGLMGMLTQFWGCPPFYTVNFKSLKKDESPIIERPTLSMICATTLDWFSATEGEIKGGFVGRFLPIVSAGGRERRIPIPQNMDENAKRNISARLKAIYNRLYTGEIEFQMDGAAKELVKTLYDQECDTYNNFQPEEKRLLGSFWSRIQTHMLKISLIFKLCKDPEGSILDRETVLNAKEFMDEVTNNYLYMMRNVSFNPMMKLENKAVELLQEARERGIKKSEFTRALHITAKENKELYATLEMKDQITCRKVSSGTNKAEIYYSPEYAPREGTRTIC